MRLLDHDYLTGVSTYHSYDHSTKRTHILTTQNVEPVIRANKERHKTSYQRDGIKKSWMHAATIPPVVQVKWKQEYGVDIYNKDHTDKIMKLLNDPEWRYLKTGDCKL